MNPFLTPQRKLRNGWWIAVFFLILAAFVIPATIYAASRQLTLTPGWQACIALTTSILCLVLRRDRLSSLFGSIASWRRGVPIGIGVGFVVWVLSAGVLWSAGSVTWQPNPNAVTGLGTAIGECLAIAVAEEVIFRGFVLQRLIDGIGAWAAQITMAAYFVLTHLNNPGLAGSSLGLGATNIFLAGLLFGATYLRTRSLALPIALHFMLNFTQGSLLGFGVSGNATTGLLIPRLSDAPAWWTGGQFGLEASLPGTVVILGVLMVAYRWRWAPVTPSGPVRAQC
jgi:uncharacterized protein